MNSTNSWLLIILYISLGIIIGLMLNKMQECNILNVVGGDTEKDDLRKIINALTQSPI